MLTMLMRWPLSLVLMATPYVSPFGWQATTPENAGTLRRQIDHSWKEANDAMRVGDWTGALAPCRRMLELEIELVGEDSYDVAGSHDSLGKILEHLGEDDEARSHFQRVLAIAEGQSGKPEWAIDAAQALDDFERRITAAPEAREELYRVELLQPRIHDHYERGQHEEALRLIGEQLAARKGVYGEEHDLCAKAYNDLGLIHGLRHDLVRAEACHQSALKIREACLGPDHSLTGESLSNVGLIRNLTGHPREAIELFERSITIMEATRGPESIEVILVLENCLICYRNLSEVVRAEEIAQRIIELTKERFGRRDSRYSSSLNGLAMVYVDSGRYEEAEELLREALALLRADRRSPPDELGRTLANLAVVYSEWGDLTRSEPCAREALGLVEKSRGKNTPSAALLLNNLAKLEMELGDTQKGIVILEQVLSIASGTLGDQSELYLSAQVSLAAMLARVGNREEALAKVTAACEALRQHFGDARYAQALGVQAEICFELGRTEAAVELGKKAMAIAHQRPEGLNPRFAILLDDMGNFAFRSGDMEGAKGFFDQALALAQSGLGMDHPQLGRILCDLARLEHARGNASEATALHRRALGLFRRHLEMAASLQSERQQLLLLGESRQVLDAYLSYATASSLTDEELYGHVLAWKGSIFARQSRKHFESRHPELAETSRALAGATNRYAALAFAPPASEFLDAWRGKLDELRTQREELEAKLAKGTTQGLVRMEQISPSDVALRLPEGTVLIDYLTYARTPPVDPKAAATGASSELHLTAFVLRRGALPRKLELGPLAPVADALATWRAEIAAGKPSPSARGILRSRIWEPLTASLAGAKLVLVSPDGILGRLPFAALPGVHAESFLIEDVALGVVAAPHLLPGLVEARRASRPSLLLVGGVDFDGTGEVQTAEAASFWRGVPHAEYLIDPRPLAPLSGTAAEVTQVAEFFQSVHAEASLAVLAGKEASETAFRNAVPAHRFVHLATHGFFVGLQGSQVLDPRAPATSLAAAATVLHPGLLSGIAFAGANVRRGEEQDDGILTALEMATLDLDGVELLTLSACETGLGAAAGGEGLLGLQRAAQISGARAVLASLWKVDDERTREWMGEFYANLWKQGLSRVESLRAAQLKMIRERRPVRDWGAWILSGDWR